MSWRITDDLIRGAVFVFGVIPGFFLTILALALLQRGIRSLDAYLILFGSAAALGYVGGLIAIFAGRDFRTKHRFIVALAILGGILALVITVPTVLSIATYQNRDWPAVLVLSTLTCGVGIFIRQLILARRNQ